MRGVHFNGSRSGRAVDHDARLALHDIRREIGRLELRGDELGKIGDRWLRKLRRRERELIDSITRAH